MLRRVQEHRLVGLFYGQRALCIGALAPLNYVGTAEHSPYLQTPFKRLAHTGKWFESVMLGSRDEADRVLAAVNHMHQRVNGTLPEDAGPYPAGTPYDALDPGLMLWTIAVMMDSAEYFYDLFIQRLSAEGREWLWQDYIRFGELFGMPREAAPPSYPQFRAYFDSRLAGEELWLTDEARFVGYAVAFEIPLPRALQPFKRLHDLVMLGSLPPRVRRDYDLPWTRAHAVASKAAAQALRTARLALPDALAQGRCATFFDLVANTEASRIAHGKPTPGISPTGEHLGPRARRAA